MIIPVSATDAAVQDNAYLNKNESAAMEEDDFEVTAGGGDIIDLVDWVAI